MTLAGFKAGNHPQQVGKRGARPEVDDRATTAEVFDPLHERFGFSIDVAASSANAKCERFYTAEDDGLSRSWADEMVWCNPPYSDIAPWLAKAWEECTSVNGIVMLLPANRTEQGWWQEYVEPYRDRARSPLTTEFMKGRLRFLAPDALVIKPNERPPFGCVLLIWTRCVPPIHPLRYRPDPDPAAPSFDFAGAPLEVATGVYE